LSLRCYAEPFAGGAGLALPLLFNSHVSDVYLNDIDPAIWSFWYAVLHRTNEFIERIENLEVSVSEWNRQKEIYREANCESPFDLGFAAFFLNRTNRSGIIKSGGVIGGLNQEGKYKIDCRFNKKDLIRRITRIAKYRNRIHLSAMDGIDFIKESKKLCPRNTFFCIDPPYFHKGSSLYTSFYGLKDHRRLAEAVLRLAGKWIVTYDDCEEVRSMYDTACKENLDIRYSASLKRVGKEILIHNKETILPKTLAANVTWQG
jgi:DNA adenine methylase